MSSTSTCSRSIAARTAFQRRSSSAVEIGVFRRSDKAISFSPGCGLAHDIDHVLEIAGEELTHVALDGGHGTILVAVRVAAEMREDRDVLRLPQRIVRRQWLLRKDIESGTGDLAAFQRLDQRGF